MDNSYQTNTERIQEVVLLNSSVNEIYMYHSDYPYSSQTFISMCPSIIRRINWPNNLNNIGKWNITNHHGSATLPVSSLIVKHKWSLGGNFKTSKLCSKKKKKKLKITLDNRIRWRCFVVAIYLQKR